VYVFKALQGNWYIIFAYLHVLIIKSEEVVNVFVHLEIKLLIIDVPNAHNIHNMLMEYAYAIMEDFKSMDNAKSYLVLIVILFMTQ